MPDSNDNLIFPILIYNNMRRGTAFSYRVECAPSDSDQPAHSENLSSVTLNMQNGVFYHFLFLQSMDHIFAR